MKTRKERLENTRQKAAIEKLLRDFRGSFKELTKDAFQVRVTIYVMKFPGSRGAKGAPHLVFFSGKNNPLDLELYRVHKMHELLLQAQGQPIVFAIRLLDYRAMKPRESELVRSSPKSAAKKFYEKLSQAPVRVEPEGRLPQYYPIGVGFNPLRHKGDTKAQIEAEAKFCRHATPFLNGGSMSIVFTKGGSLNHLPNYKLMVQSSDGTIGTIDPGSGHTDKPQ